MAELTPVGLVTRRYPEILSSIRAAMRSEISSSLAFEEDLFLGQVTQILAREHAALEEMLQALNDSWDKDKAEANSLDKLLYLVGLERRRAAKSSGYVQFTCNTGITVNRGTLLQNPSSGDTFVTTTSKLATPSACTSVTYTVEIQDNTLYRVTINGLDYTFTSGVGATSNSIATGLLTAINNASSDLYEATLTTISSEDALVITSKKYLDELDVSVLQHLTPVRVVIDVPAEASVYGVINAPEGAITRILSGGGGILGITNPVTFGVGRLEETDTQFRVRAEGSLSIRGGATYAAMYTALSNLPQISNLLLVENATANDDTGIGGLPPHSFEAIMDVAETDANKKAIAEVLWNTKPLGIESYGNTPVVFIDANGQPRNLSYSKPDSVWIDIKVSYSLYSEETPSDNISDLIRAEVLRYSRGLTTGVDVIPRRFIGGIYNAVEGLDEVVVEARTLDGASGSPLTPWSEDRIPISNREKPAFDSADIAVVTL